MSKYIKWILAVLWTAFIVYGLTQTPSEIPRFPWLAMDGIDKVIHAILFGAEAFLLVWAASRNHFMSAALILGWCFILGGGLELVQFYFVEGRDGDFLDLLADMVGAVLGYALYGYLVRK